VDDVVNLKTLSTFLEPNLFDGKLYHAVEFLRKKIKL